MSVLRVRGGARLAGRVVPPPDKSITHRALICAALARGTSTLRAPGMGADNRSTRAVLEALGVGFAGPDRALEVTGVGGPGGLAAPDGPLDCGNSGTTLRLMAGVLAARPGRAALTGDASLRARPMARLRPLEAMGARLEGEGDRLTPPLVVHGAALEGADHRLWIASAQVKSALLLAGCFARRGRTTVREPARSRDHTERALRALGVPVTEGADGALSVDPLDAPWAGFEAEVPPDFSSAAFLLAAGALTDGEVWVDTGVNPLRTGFLDALAAFGVGVQRASSDVAAFGGEPCASLSARGRPTRAADIADPISLRALDELPLVAVLAGCAPERSTIRDAAELRVKESDRIEQTVALLAAFGIPASATVDGLDVAGGGPTRAATVDAGHDHRIGLCAAVLALAAPGVSEIRGAEIIEVSYPGFARVLRGLGAEVEYRA